MKPAMRDAALIAVGCNLAFAMVLVGFHDFPHAVLSGCTAGLLFLVTRAEGESK